MILLRPRARQTSGTWRCPASVVQRQRLRHDGGNRQRAQGLSPEPITRATAWTSPAPGEVCPGRSHRRRSRLIVTSQWDLPGECSDGCRMTGWDQAPAPDAVWLFAVRLEPGWVREGSLNGTALVRVPSSKLAEGIVTHMSRTPVDVALAVLSMPRTVMRWRPVAG